MRYLLLAAALAMATAATAQTVREYDIAPQPLEAALRQLVETQNLQIVYDPRDVRGFSTRGVKGTFSQKEALEQLVSGTGITVVVGDRGSVVLKPPPPGDNPSPDKKSEGQGGGVSSQERIFVTAQKRSELLTDVPVPVTAIRGDALANSQQLQLQEYYSRVPGLSLNYDGIRSGLPTLAIRGIRTSNAGNPTVGIVVDDVPYGSATAIGGGGWVPDIDPGDLARIEVLRGPQGALYGASSMGGLLKFVTVDPMTDRFRGRVQAGVSDVEGGGQPGHVVRGSVNVPLSESAAIRASAFSRRDPGYIDNPGLGLEDTNRNDAEGGRVALMWHLPNASSLKLGALYQRLDSGPSYMNPALGDLVQSGAPKTGWIERKFQVYDATYTGTFAGVDVTSITAYSDNLMKDSVDATAFFGRAASFDETVKTKKFSQEVRAVFPVGRSVSWLVGGFYSDEESNFLSPVVSLDPVTGERTGLLSDFTSPTTFREAAVFSTATITFSPRFDVQIGGRYARDRIGANTVSVSGTGVVTASPEIDVTESTFTYLVTPRYRFSESAMAYVRLASGYRAGGVNLQATLPANADLPLMYDPDFTRNYEVGIKGDIGRGLSYDMSLFYIDWKDVQLALVAPGRTAGYMDNGGTARSQGIEIAVESRPTTGLTLAAWVVYNQAKLTADFPSTSSVRGFAGDRLPYSSRWSGNIAIDKEFPLWTGASGFVGASASYVDDRVGVFRGPAMTATGESLPKQMYESYTKVDLRAGVIHGPWRADFFVNNVTDERGVLAGGLGATFPTAFSFIQPRMAGLSITRNF